jgi:serine/threonine-protein kinase
MPARFRLPLRISVPEICRAQVDDMSVTSVAALVDLLRESNLLQPAQLQLAATDMQAEYSDPRAAADMLVRRKWLTSYQVDKLLNGERQNLTLGPYILLEPLGEGGMGQVFKARHQVLDRVVALKLIREERLSKDPEAVRRFQREARAAALLSHPNIVLIYDADRSGDTYFIAMEYIDGTDLGRWVKEAGPLAVGQACDFIRQAALGLQCAHEAGMVHRDIKPSNLLAAGLHLSRQQQGRGLSLGAAPAIPGGRQPRHSSSSDRTPVPNAPVIKILDMGLVRLAQKDDGQTGASLTQEGSIIGTPDYIAPEQARNAHRVDIRADLYSLGGTFYYLLTGQPPFTEGSAIEKLLMHQLDEPTPVTQLRSEVPADVAAIVHKLMSKFPKDRFQTPGDLADVLSKLSPARPSSPSSGDSRKKPDTRAMPLGLARSAVTPPPVKTVAEAAPKGPPPPAPQPTRAPAPPPTARAPAPPATAKGPAKESRAKATSETEAEWRGTVTPPPDQLAASVYNWAPGGLGQKTGKEPAKHIAQLKGHNGCIMTLAFTSSRDLLASGGVDGTVRLWDFTGSKPCEKASMHKHRDAVHSVAFSPNNKLLASGSGAMDGIVWVFNVSQDQPKEMSVLQGHQGPVDALTFSPDSKLVASGGNDLTLRVWEVDRQSKPKAVLKGHIRPIKGVVFSPDGQTLASAAQDYTVRLWTIGRMWSKERAALAHEAEVYSVAFSPDGKLLATASQDQLVRLWDLSLPKPTVKTTLKGSSGSVRAVIITPDGKMAVGVSEDRQAINWDLETGEIAREWELPKWLNPAYALTVDGRYLAHGASDGVINVYRIAEKRLHSR